MMDLITPDMNCVDHKRYTGRRKPRFACASCWFIYLAAKGWIHPETEDWLRKEPKPLEIK